MAMTRRRPTAIAIVVVRCCLAVNIAAAARATISSSSSFRGRGVSGSASSSAFALQNHRRHRFVRSHCRPAASASASSSSSSRASSARDNNEDVVKDPFVLRGGGDDIGGSAAEASSDDLAIMDEADGILDAATVAFEADLAALAEADGILDEHARMRAMARDGGGGDEEPLSFQNAVFSDIDGTLVHYPKDVSSAVEDMTMICLPPSKTGLRGVISSRTMMLANRLRQGDGGSYPPTAAVAPDVAEASREQWRMRNGGAPFVLITGARTTTLLDRLPYLPRADAYVSESGGRIFYPRPVVTVPPGHDEEGADNDGLVRGLVVRPVPYPGMSPSDASPFALVEDMHWRDGMSEPNAAGDDGYEGGEDEVEAVVSPHERKGKLWDFARALASKRGLVVDASGYATAFRVNRKHQECASDFDDFLEMCTTNKNGIIPDGLDCSTNLGCVDVYPTMSGKKNCAEYLVRRLLSSQGGGEGGNRNGGVGAQQREISLGTHAFCLCDDDNDAEMALACRAAYLPGVGSRSMQDLADASRDKGDGKLVVMEDTDGGVVGTRATEAALEATIEALGR